jgi:hypothetical protein
VTRKAFSGFIFVCSLVFNIAIIAMWLTHTAQCRFSDKNIMSHSIFNSCPLQNTLRLTASQFDSVKPRFEVFHSSAQQICGRVQISRAALVNELEKPQPDTSVLKNLGLKILSEQQKLQELSIKHLLEEKRTLSPEQRNRLFSEIRKNMGCDSRPVTFGLEK